MPCPEQTQKTSARSDDQRRVQLALLRASSSVAARAPLLARSHCAEAAAAARLTTGGARRQLSSCASGALGRSSGGSDVSIPFKACKHPPVAIRYGCISHLASSRTCFCSLPTRCTFGTIDT